LPDSLPETTNNVNPVYQMCELIASTTVHYLVKWRQ